MSSHTRVHVIKKADVGKHKVVSLPPPSLPPLEEGVVRGRTAIISLTSNNLAYARLGTQLNWWETYPVPSELQPPYNDSDEYGIVPAWGFGEVLESKVSGIEAGMLLHGFWPTMGLPVDLKLEPADAPNHWIEVSEGRRNLMNLYQRYSLRDSTIRAASLSKAQVEALGWEAALRGVFEAGFLLSTAVFGKPAIHPLGTGPWDVQQADLSAAVVISLSASGKTARGFTDGLINHRRDELPPLGLLAITSNSTGTLIPKAALPTKTVSYEQMTDSKTLDWIALQQPRKIVIVDFGGRGDSPPRLVNTIKEHFSAVEVMVIGVGGNPEAQTQEEVRQWAQQNTAIAERIQMNTSPLKDELMRRDGPEVYFKRLIDAWNAYRKSDSVKGLNLEVGSGIDGFGEGWTKLCEGKVPSDAVLAYKI